VTDPPPPDVVFEGNSRDVIRSFPKDIRSDLGADLDRVQNGDKPLDSASMAPVLPGVFELRDEDQDFWYRVLYKQIEGVVYVIHCFKKKTNKTSLNDIKVARERLSGLKERLAEQKKKKSLGLAA
jgi:phage-related protein